MSYVQKRNYKSVVYSIRKKLVVFPLIILVCVMIGINRLESATYYASPGDDLGAAVSNLSPGDTLILRDGTYYSFMYVNVSGTASQPITIKAENDGGAIVDGEWARGAFRADYGASYIVVEGICFQNATGSAVGIYGQYITMRRVSGYGSSGNNTHVYTLAYAHDIYLEDCASSGRGRNNYLLYDGYNYVLRRCWGWWMQTNYGGPDLCGQTYGVRDTYVENCIMTVDPNPIADGGVGAWNYWAATYNSEHGINNYVDGCVFYGFDHYFGFPHQHDSDKQQYNNVIRNTALMADPATTGDVYVDQYGGYDFFLENVTMVGWRARQYNHAGYGAYGEDIYMYVKNSSFVNSDIGLEIDCINNGGHLTHSYNNFNNVQTPFSNTTQGTGETFIDPGYDAAKYGMGAYLIRPSSLEGAGEGGSDMGAEVLYKSVDGVITDEPLWPWPMEDRIQQETERIFGRRLSVTWESMGGIWKTLDGVYDFAPTKVVANANPTIIQGGGNTSVVTAELRDASDRLAISSTAEITFSITSGGGNLVGANPINASGGMATITYQSGAQEETVTVTATSSGLTQGSVNINVVTNDPPNAPSALLCDGKDNPINLTDVTPDLSWTFSDPDSGDTQSAYRILVADSQSNIDNNNGNIWDTTKVPSAENNITYAGTVLEGNKTYYWKVMVWDNFDASSAYSQVETFTTADTDPRAFHGIPMGIPGKIEIEDFDLGGEGVAYHDTTGSNSGDANYRPGESVDISNDGSGGYLIAGNPQGEWLEYTVDVAQTGTYTIDVIVGATGLGGTFHIEFDGVDKTGLLQVPDTGTGGCWNVQTVSRTGVSLTQGRQIMRLAIDSNHSQWSDYCGCMHYINITLQGQVTPTITVTSPDGGETWTVNTQAAVTWTSVGTVGNAVGIDLSTDGGSSWSALISNTANDGQESVTVPDSQSTNCRIRVQDVDVTPSDMSDNNFTITSPVQPQITVTVPNGQETWTAGDTETVTWTSQGSVGNAVNIDLSTDGGTNWSTLISGTANDGLEQVMVPGSTSTTCKIRVEDVSGSPSDMSNSNFTIEEAPGQPAISVNPAALDFGEIEIGKTGALDFRITNTGGGILSGSISTDKKWVEVEPTSFEGNNVTVSVTVDNSVLNKKEGQHTGTISITSNGGNIDIAVQLSATCVLAKPNPYDPTKGPLAFFGDGIVPKETTIKIYTLSGELIKTLGEMRSEAESRLSGEIVWDGKNDEGKEVANGIYIYIYESPKEKGIGKFTVIRQ